MQDLQFFSFEHHPDEPCRITCGSLYDKPELIHHVVDVWHNDELPASVPFYIMEWNLSSSTSETYEDIFGGLWLADYIGSFLIPLSAAATRAGCNDSAGTFGMFTVHNDYSVDQPLPQFYASQMINQEWLQADGANQIFVVASDVLDGAAHALITAYAPKRADGRSSVMLVNRDQDSGHHVALEFARELARQPISQDLSTWLSSGGNSMRGIPRSVVRTRMRRSRVTRRQRSIRADAPLLTGRSWQTSECRPWLRCARGIGGGVER